MTFAPTSKTRLCIGRSQPGRCGIQSVTRSSPTDGVSRTKGAVLQRVLARARYAGILPHRRCHRRRSTRAYRKAERAAPYPFVGDQCAHGAGDTRQRPIPLAHAPLYRRHAHEGSLRPEGQPVQDHPDAPRLTVTGTPWPSGRPQTLSAVKSAHSEIKPTVRVPTWVTTTTVSRGCACAIRVMDAPNRAATARPFSPSGRATSSSPSTSHRRRISCDRRPTSAPETPSSTPMSYSSRPRSGSAARPNSAASISAVSMARRAVLV